MGNLVIPADAEDVARLHIEAGLHATTGFTTVAVLAGTKPKTLPAEFLFIRRTGGPMRDIVTDLPQLTFEAYAKTGARAVAILNRARALVAAAARAGRMGTTTVYEAREFVGPYSDPDPDAPLHTRYSATIQVAVRGSAA